MTQPVLHSIPINAIHKSPYQHRKDFNPDKLNELAKSIERDGLIEPIVVRRNAAGYELIAGERRWRATQITSQSEILARVVEATDLQARRMCAAENMQRQDLGAVEEVYAITELIDAEMIEDDTYSLSAETPTDRVKWLLRSLDSGHNGGETTFFYKFVEKVESIFDSLPRPREWRSFYLHDFRTITTIDEDVKEIAIHNQLNKSQTKELDALKKDAPAAFNELVRQSDEHGRITIEPLPFEEDGPRDLRDLGAREIKSMRYQGQPLLNHQLINASTNNEWYTPRPFVDAAHEVMGGIDLDPASNAAANQIVRAECYYTIVEDGYTQPWGDTDTPLRVWLNPPYGTDDEDSSESNQARWSRRLINEYRAGHVSEAVLLVNAVTGNTWFAPLKSYPICFPDKRIRFYNTDTEAGQPTHGNALVYFGPNVAAFVRVFARFGAVMARLDEYDGHVFIHGLETNDD
jgi:ParB-like nuclease family protein/DNA N-6-adenine-methyltransferase Dam